MVRPVLSTLDLLVEVLFGDAPEWEGAGEHDVEEDAQGPHVDGLAVVLVLADDLRAHVAGRAAEDLQALVRGHHHREAEVDQLHHAGALLDEDVVELDVTVDGVDAVKVGHGLCHLLEDPPRRRLPHNAVRQRLGVLLKRDALDVVGYDVDLLRSVD